MFYISEEINLDVRAQMTKNELNDVFIQSMFEKHKNTNEFFNRNLMNWLKDEVRQRKEYLIRMEKFKKKI